MRGLCHVCYASGVEVIASKGKILCKSCMNKKTNNSVINIGSGKDFTINYYVSKVLDILNIKTKIYYDKTKPTGTPRKLLDCSLAKKYGWHPKTTLRVGLEKTIKAFKNKNIHF